MDTSQLKSYAPAARVEFIEAVTNKAAVYGLLPDEILRCRSKGMWSSSAIAPSHALSPGNAMN